MDCVEWVINRGIVNTIRRECELRRLRMRSKVICTLNIESNTCPHYSSEDNSCGAEQTGCSFRQVDEPVAEYKQEYKREPRWYEQYYRK